MNPTQPHHPYRVALASPDVSRRRRRRLDAITWGLCAIVGVAGVRVAIGLERGEGPTGDVVGAGLVATVALVATASHVRRTR